MSNRKTILVDLDNVVYDWVAAMADWLRTNNAVHPSRYLVDEYRSWEVWEDWNIPKGEFIRWWRLGVEAGEIYAKGPLIHGAREALWKLSDAEWDIHIATNRLTKFGLHDQIIINTASWLRDNNIPYRQLSFVAQKRHLLASAIVDDRADNMHIHEHDKVFLFPANHNAGRVVTKYEQLKTWEAIVEKLGGGIV